MYYQGRLGPCESVTRERVHMTLCPLWGRACGMLRVMERSFGLRLRLPGAASRAGVFSVSPGRALCMCRALTPPKLPDHRCQTRRPPRARPLWSCLVAGRTHTPAYTQHGAHRVHTRSSIPLLCVRRHIATERGRARLSTPCSTLSRLLGHSHTRVFISHIHEHDTPIYLVLVTAENNRTVSSARGLRGAE